MNKRGFTFIEVLGVISLLAIISVIVMVVVDKSLKDSKDILYNTQLENIKSAAGMWRTDNIELIPDEGYYTTTLGILQNDGYISSEIQTLIDNQVYGREMFVKIGLNDILIVPNDSYKMLEYVGTDGGQYIKLGYIAKTTTEIRLDIEFFENGNTHIVGASGINVILGLEEAIGDRFNINFGAQASQYNKIYYWLDKPYVTGGPTYDRVYANILGRSTMIVKSGSAIFQNITHTVETKSADNSDKTILLGGYNSTVEKIVAFDRYDTKIYGFKIYEGDSLVFDMVPFYRKSDGVAGLYNLIDGTFYASDGSNDFLFEL